VTILTEFAPNIFYLVGLAIAIFLEHRWFYERYKDQELIRRAIGISTVFLPSGFLVDHMTSRLLWLTIGGGFLVAAAVKVLMDDDDDDGNPLNGLKKRMDQINVP